MFKFDEYLNLIQMKIGGKELCKAIYDLSPSYHGKTTWEDVNKVLKQEAYDDAISIKESEDEDE